MFLICQADPKIHVDGKRSTRNIFGVKEQETSSGYKVTKTITSSGLNSLVIICTTQQKCMYLQKETCQPKLRRLNLCAASLLTCYFFI